MSESVSDPNWDQEEFRQNIEGNLSAGAFVLVIAVDDMNEELLRTMRFLNICGNPIFHFSVLETKRFQKNDTEILVPHLHGVFSQSKPKQSRRGRWSEFEFFAELEKNFSSEINSIYKDIFEWIVQNADRVWFGTGSVTGSVTFHYLLSGQSISVFTIYTNGYIIINLGYLSGRLEEEIILNFYHNLVELPPFEHIPADFNRWPSVLIEEAFLDNSEYLDKFKQIVEDLGKKIPK